MTGRAIRKLITMERLPLDAQISTRMMKLTTGTERIVSTRGARSVRTTWLAPAAAASSTAARRASRKPATMRRNE